MAFNGFIDVPTIIMIVFYTSLYPFRNDYPEAFTRFTFFIAYYIKFVTIFKAFHMIVGNVEYIHDINESNPESTRVIALKVIFGRSFSMPPG